MSRNTLISVGVGLAAAVAIYFAPFTGGQSLYWAAVAFSVASSVTGAILGPDAVDNGKMRPDEFQMNQSSEAATIPVVFGRTRVAANYIYVDAEAMTATPIEQKQKGGKGGGGGGSQVAGYSYTLPLSFGICMGPIDRLKRIVTSPGYYVMKKFDGLGLDFPDGDPDTFDCIASRTSGETISYEGGECVFYPGSASQIHTEGEVGKNRRHFCWIDFPSYRIDGQPSPTSLLFEVERMPVVLDENGAEIPNFRTRATDNNSYSEYFDANPAAVAWELFTNRIWGRGLSAEFLDKASFKQASQYYFDNRIGISTAIGDSTLQDFIGRLRDIFGLLVWWDGQFLRARCLYDRTGYSDRVVIQPEDIMGDAPSISRQSASSAYNELRLEFTNRENNWQAEHVSMMMLAHVETVGGVRTQSMDGKDIGTRRTAQLLGRAILRQLAYPPATCSLKIRRTHSGLQPGAFVQVNLDELSEGETGVTYWRVVDVQDGDQSAEGVSLSLMEDIYAPAYFGDADELDDDPPGTIEDDSPLANGDIVTGGSISEPRPAGTIDPIIAWEPNIFITQAARRIAIMPSRSNQYIIGATASFSLVGDAATVALDSTALLPFTGTLLDSIPATGSRLASPSQGRTFRIQMTHAADAQRMADATGAVMDDADGWESLLVTNEAFMLVENELIRIGWAEVTSAGVVTVRSWLACQAGTSRASHSIGSIVAFFPSFDATGLADATKIPYAKPVNLHLSQVMIGTQPDVTPTDHPADLSGITYGGRSVMPFKPVLDSASRTGDTWTVWIRPRVHDQGVETTGLEDALKNPIVSLDDLSIRFIPAGGPPVTVDADTNFTTPPFTMPSEISVDSLRWFPEDGNGNDGLIRAVLTFDSSPATMAVRMIRKGRSSQTLTISEP